jgi:hypothetical protein
MISTGGHRQPDACPRAGARLYAMRGRLALTGRWRLTLGLVLGLMLCGPVVSGLASPGGGRASQQAVGRSGSVAVVAGRRARLAELDVSAAAVRLLAGNVLAGSATVGNVGSVRARSSTADVAWKSSDSGGLVQLGKFPVPALKPGQRHKAKFQFDLPKGASGKYEVSVCADVLGQVHSKKNDCRDAGVITIPGSGVKASGPTSSEPSSPSGSPPGGSSTPPASSPPDTVIDSGPSGVIGVFSVTFTFHGSDANDTFQCSLDGAPWVSCTSPQQYTSLAEGAHTFQVRAINAAGEVDPTPASASFTVEATPPQTTITSAPSGRVPIGEVSISFTSTEPASSFQCSLDGAAYSPCVSPDVVKDPAAGPHTFSVEATNQAGIKETAGPPSTSWSSVEPQHDLCGTISSNTTTGPDYAARYVITCTVTVASSATLTAQSGTIIKFDNATKLSVDGTLNAVGTSSEPITFTSINDNSVGGATGNGSPAVSEWSGIEVLGAQSSVDMQHVSIGYSDNGLRVEGSEAPVIFSDDAVGNVALRGVEVAKAREGATFSDDVIEDAGYEGIEVRESGATSVTDSTVSAAGYAIEEEHPAGPVTVTGNSVAQVTNATYGAERGIAVRENQAGEAVKIADNTLVMLAGAAIEVDSPSLDFAELATNTISGPESTRLVLVEGTVAASQTLGPEPFAWGLGIQQGPLEVPTGVTLTIAPGALVKAGHERSGCGEPGGCVDLYGADSKLVVHGSLSAIGTMEKPIIFTSINDNSIGGETGDGTPEPGEWAGIEVLGAKSSVDMQHVSISYAGDGLYVEGSEAPVTFNDDVVRSAALRGVEVTKAKADATFSNDVIENAEYEGIEVRESGAVSVTASTVSAGAFAVEADAPAGPVTITDDSLSQVSNLTYTYHVGGRGVEVRENRAGEAVSVAHNALAMLAGAAIEVDSPSLDFAELATNTTSGPESTRLVLVEGTVAASQTLESEPFAWGIGIQQGPLEVPVGATLTIAPGTVVKAGHERSCEIRGCFDSYGAESKLEVKGSLDAVGTASEPIVFTSINDNSVGGATGDGTPETNEWPGIEEAGASAVLDLADVSVRYAGTALNVTAGTAAIRGSFDAEHDLNGLQACIWGGGCSVDAAYTYWGTPSGPGSSGGTDAACGAVTTTPYLTSPTGEETATESSVFAPGDCGSGTTPPQELTTSEASTAVTVDGLESLCRETHEEAVCEVVRQYDKCMAAATTLAQHNASFNFSDDAQDAASAGASFIAESEKAVVSSLASVASFGLELIGVANTIHEIAAAYNTCDP